MKLVPHVVHVLFNIILGVVPLLLQSVLHDHLTLRKVQTGTVQRFSEGNHQARKTDRSVGGFNHDRYLILHKKIQHVNCQLPLWTVFNW